jgi:hypothetical protein
MRALFLALLVLFAAAPAFAQETEGPATPRSWQSLSPQQQQLLHNFQGNWDTLPADKQAALARGSDRWVHMTPEERSGAQERFKTWRALPPEQRQQLRERWHQFKALPPQQQQQIRRQFNAFRQMPPERQQALRNAWRNMSPEQRNQWRNMSPEQRRGALERSEGAMPRGPAGPRAAPRRPHWSVGRRGRPTRDGPRRRARRLTPRRARNGSGSACSMAPRARSSRPGPAPRRPPTECVPSA